jgi:hypothetical protein
MLFAKPNVFDVQPNLPFKKDPNTITLIVSGTANPGHSISSIFEIQMLEAASPELFFVPRAS